MSTGVAGVAMVILRATEFLLQIALVRRIRAMQDERAGRVGTITAA